MLVKVVSSGLCGSDIPRIFAQGAHYYPITLGHEFSGYVESYGSQTNAAIAQSAGTQIGKTLFYDAAYVRLDYPNGDLPLERGVCA
ncbi:DUF1287 domain-containing protein, partial [Salmonella enterica subsp. enterica serovar Kentucky]|nr:DUF1287 domain-containing protein [Salmonella enterica subsp. enterica serovar Kentucky]